MGNPGWGRNNHRHRARCHRWTTRGTTGRRWQWGRLVQWWGRQRAMVVRIMMMIIVSDVVVMRVVVVIVVDVDVGVRMVRQVITATGWDV